MNYLDAAIARAKLPIKVQFSPWQVTGIDHYAVHNVAEPMWKEVHFGYTAAQATQAYLILCASLDPGASLPASGSSDGCSATEPPRGGM